MNINHLKIIADYLQFKLTTQPAQQIPAGPGGGHLCWKVKSENETFFIKQLDPKIAVNDKKIIDRYEICESVAFRFAQQGIPAVYALKHKDKSVTIIEDTAYLVYPWIEGHKLKNEISENHAIKIAQTMAKIHAINLNVPEIEPKLDIYTNEKIIASLEKAIECEPSVSEILRSNQDMILSMNDRYHSAISALKEKNIIIHGDIFPHNVLWEDADHPFLIDWEAVKKWNPTREAIRTCIAWGGVGTEPLTLSLFEKMLKIYINFGGPLDKNHIDAALNGIYGSVIYQLVSNIDLVINNSDVNNTAVNGINNSLSAGTKLTRLFPILLKSATSIF